jgi:glycosyltransferase involved in cell wall biosynthesis
VALSSDPTDDREHGYFSRAVTKVIPGAITRPITVPSWKGADDALPLRVGYIGMLTPNKGTSTLGAAAELLGKDAPFEYLIAGDGKPEFVQQVLSKFPESRTSYLGWVNSSSFYPSIDVLVVPSVSAEAFGYVCIEALSFGVPVLVARSGALPEIIEDGKSGLIFEAGDHEALAACLRRIASDRRLLNRLHRGALARARHYSPEAFAESLHLFLRQVRGSRSRVEPADRQAGARRPTHAASLGGTTAGRKLT